MMRRFAVLLDAIRKSEEAARYRNRLARLESSWHRSADLSE
jgi:hypothetical protein